MSNSNMGTIYLDGSQCADNFLCPVSNYTTVKQTPEKTLYHNTLHPSKQSFEWQIAKTIELAQSFSASCSIFQQNQDTPQGALKLLPFRLPKDIQKANDEIFFFSSILLLSQLLAEWQVRLVTNRACNMLQICQG